MESSYTVIDMVFVWLRSRISKRGGAGIKLNAKRWLELQVRKPLYLHNSRKNFLLLFRNYIISKFPGDIKYPLQSTAGYSPLLRHTTELILLFAVTAGPLTQIVPPCAITFVKSQSPTRTPLNLLYYHKILFHKK